MAPRAGRSLLALFSQPPLSDYNEVLRARQFLQRSVKAAEAGERTTAVAAAREGHHTLRCLWRALEDCRSEDAAEVARGVDLVEGWLRFLGCSEVSSLPQRADARDPLGPSFAFQGASRIHRSRVFGGVRD